MKVIMSMSAGKDADDLVSSWMAGFNERLNRARVRVVSAKGPKKAVAGVFTRTINTYLGDSFIFKFSVENGKLSVRLSVKHEDDTVYELPEKKNETPASAYKRIHEHLVERNKGSDVRDVDNSIESIADPKEAALAAAKAAAFKLLPVQSSGAASLCFLITGGIIKGSYLVQLQRIEGRSPYWRVYARFGTAETTTKLKTLNSETLINAVVKAINTVRY